MKIRIVLIGLILLTVTSLINCSGGGGTVVPAEDSTPPLWDNTTGITAITPGDRLVTISWGTASDAETPGVEYLIYFDYDNDPWNKTPIIVTGTTSFAVTELENSEVYWFGVRCRDTSPSQNEDDNSIVISSIPFVMEDVFTPTLFGSSEEIPVIHNFDIWGDYAYIINPDTGFSVMDISDPANPGIVGNLNLGSAPEYIDVQEQYAFVSCANRSMYIIDVSNPLTPTLINSISANVYDVVAQGDFLYIKFDDQVYSGITLFDISDIQNPLALGSITILEENDNYLSSGISNLIVRRDTAYVTSSFFWTGEDACRFEFTAADFSDPLNPSKMQIGGKKCWILGFPVISGDYVFFKVKEFSNAAGIQPLNIINQDLSWGHLLEIGHVSRFALIDDYIFAAADSMFHIINITTPWRPVIQDSIELHSGNVKIKGKYAYIGSYSNGFFCIQLW